MFTFYAVLVLAAPLAVALALWVDRIAPARTMADEGDWSDED